jgi:hypothetical protein
VRRLGGPVQHEQREIVVEPGASDVGGRRGTVALAGDDCGFEAKRAGAHYGRAPELLALILENCVLDVCA